MERIKQFWRNAAVKNAGWLIGGRIAQMVLSLLVGLLTARYLGPSNYGLIQYANGYTALFMSLCTLGLNSILVKELIEHPQEEGIILGTSLGMRMLSSLMSAGVIMCLVSVVDANETVTLAVAALSCLGLVFQVFETFRYWFQSKLRSKVTAMITLAAYVITSVLRVVFLALEKNVVWFAFAAAFDHGLVALLLLVLYLQHGGKRLSYSLAVAKRLLNQSKHFILAGIMVSVYSQTDKLMIKQMLSQAEVGYYATATTINGMWCFVLTAIIDSVYPSIMKVFKTDNEAFKQRNRQLYAMVFYVALGVGVFICLFAEQIVKVLYGAEFMQAANPLRIVVWYTAFSYLGVARNAWVVCEERQNLMKYTYTASAVCNVGMNLVMIPRWGATGAALASLITQVIVTMFIPLFIRGLKENSILIIEGIALPFRWVHQRFVLRRRTRKDLDT